MIDKVERGRHHDRRLASRELVMIKITLSQHDDQRAQVDKEVNDRPLWHQLSMTYAITEVTRVCFCTKWSTTG